MNRSVVSFGVPTLVGFLRLYGITSYRKYQKLIRTLLWIEKNAIAVKAAESGSGVVWQGCTSYSPNISHV